MILPGRGEDIDSLESSLGFPSVLHIGRMNADITGLHQELLVSTNVLLFPLQNNENLLCGMTVDGKNATWRVFDEADKGIVSEN